MYRSLPLCAVLLAFWLGRETAADKPRTPGVQEIGRFDVLEVNYLRAGMIALDDNDLFDDKSATDGPRIFLTSERIVVESRKKGRESKVEILPHLISVGDELAETLRIGASAIDCSDRTDSNSMRTVREFVTQPTKSK